jgi:hypothetical protein
MGIKWAKCDKENFKNLLPMKTRNYARAMLATADLRGLVRTLNGRTEWAESP